MVCRVGVGANRDNEGQGRPVKFFNHFLEKEVEYNIMFNRVEYQLTPTCKLTLRLGDITTVPSNAVVNAANRSLIAGGGVDGAIHKAAGPSVQRQLNIYTLGTHLNCEEGGVVVTTAGELPAQYIFHTVGPHYVDGQHGEADLLASCYQESLRWAEALSCAVITFPAISTGVYRYPLSEAAKVALDAICTYIREESAETIVEEIIFVLFTSESFDAFKKAMAELAETPIQNTANAIPTVLPEAADAVGEAVEDRVRTTLPAFLR